MQIRQPLGDLRAPRRGVLVRVETSDAAHGSGGRGGRGVWASRATSRQRRRHQARPRRLRLRRDDAREALSIFIREAYKQGVRCVRVVHGKGLGSPGKVPVLKHRVHGWLVQKNEVLAFVQAKPADGGAGALVVLLMPSRS